MIFYMNLISIVIAVSLDGFGVGITYGMRNIRISFLALLTIMLCSGVIVLCSMLVGNILRMFISPAITSVLGSIILIMLGLFVLYSNIHSKKNQQISHDVTNKDENKFSHFKSVMSDPHQADKDRSGSISVGEAFVLGIALALDAFGAGFGAAMLGYSPMLTSFLVATMSGLFVYSGIKIGLLLSKNKLLAKLTFLPPILLICIGVYNLV
ncbi:sporulation membrane protein YtaF [Pseudogracilibacillus auburnensis]|uniref:Putative sporulation protein YtaF n=1 Tax=Pseudogracilibacillus auburnensis TaxID=1494959 RepID=A0A2V3W4Q7_9BACI|nr:sporulation membrane protein YtaF [Pseudogracilibacillus auburnensis]MBO1004862.1 sporulation membrane protein YtaF [Pseudogracilibacillus auburnensis]PXW88068.1 putative sporulation protein YtaF [Pseudogracilibacillus auburnensis]